MNILDFLTGNDLESEDTNFKSYTRVSWVYACVNVIASSISSAPLVFYKRKPGKGRVLIERGTHELYDLFNPPKGPEVPSLRELLLRTYTHLGIDGICYWVFYLKRGKLSEVDLKSKHQLFPVKNKAGRLIGWEERKDGRTVATFDVKMVIPMKYYQPSDIYSGLSPLRAAMLSVEQERNIASWNSGFFKSGMRTPMVLETSKTLTPKQRAALRDDVQQFYSGSVNGHGAFIAEGGLKATPVPLSSKDIDFIEGKQLTREEICAVYGVPPAVVGIFRYSNYANTKEQRKIFWEQTLLPKMRSLTDNIQINLLNSDYPDIEIDWDLNDVFGLRPDMTDVANSAASYLQMGYNLEQIALILDMPLLSPRHLGLLGAPGNPKPNETQPTPSNSNVTAGEPKPPKKSSQSKHDFNVSRIKSLIIKFSKLFPECKTESGLSSLEEMWDCSMKKEFDRIYSEAVLEAQEELGVSCSYEEWKLNHSFLNKSLLIWAELNSLEDQVLDTFSKMKELFFGVENVEEPVLKWRLFLEDSKLIDFFSSSLHNLMKCTVYRLNGLKEASVFFENSRETKKIDLSSGYLSEKFLDFSKNSVIFHSHKISP